MNAGESTCLGLDDGVRSWSVRTGTLVLSTPGAGSPPRLPSPLGGGPFGNVLDFETWRCVNGQGAAGSHPMVLLITSSTELVAVATASKIYSGYVRLTTGSRPQRRASVEDDTEVIRCSACDQIILILIDPDAEWFDELNDKLSAHDEMHHAV